MKDIRGFTLIELMIVVAIIAILAAIAISQYQDYVAKAQVSEAFTMAAGMRTSMVETYTQSAVCPENNEYGVPSATSIAGRYVLQTVTGGTPSANGGCTLTMTFKGAGSVSAGLANRNIVFTLTGIVDGPARWVCDGSAISAKYLPATCQ